MFGSLSRSRKIAITVVAAAAVAGGGAAVAATQLTPSDRSKAIINDAAGRLGVQPSALSDALKKAIEDQIDAAVAAGQLTQAEGNAIKQRIEAGDYPPLGFGGMGMHGGFGFARGAIRSVVDAAASYLGLSVSDLRSDLESGKTLAAIATSQGKTAAGLEQAILDAAQKQLSAAVSSGELTQAQADAIKSELQQHLGDLVNGTFPGPGMGPRMGHMFGGRGMFGGGGPGGFGPGGGRGPMMNFGPGFGSGPTA